MCRDVHSVDKHLLPTPQLCREVSALLLEQLLFAQLLTSDLDGGVTMATRTQSIHFLNGILAVVDMVHYHTVMYTRFMMHWITRLLPTVAMVFDELLIKLITSDHTH